MSIYKNYGLTDKFLDVKLNDSFDRFLYKNVWLPCYCVAEYEKFLIVEVLPHINPNASQGESHLYKLTVNKPDIYFGDIEIRY
jgi:hypothetical protein